MLSISQMETIRHQFDSFCQKVLREESRNLKVQYARRAEREVALSQLSEKQLQEFRTEDRYPSDVICFEVGRHCVSVQDERLADALSQLSEEKRDIILLAYFLDMNDREIGEKLAMVRRTVQRRRTSTLCELKKRLETKQDG